jgi:enoyl-CoA hydratase
MTDTDAVGVIGVRVSYQSDAIRITLDRPPVNAFTVGMFRELTEVLDSAQGDQRPLLLSGHGGIFSAGFDIKSPKTEPAVVIAAARACIRAVQEHRAPTVAAVDGAAVGLGLLIATSADILTVSRSARLRMPEVTLGITSDVEPLRRYLPDPWIRRLCLMGDMYTAEQLHFDSAGAILCEPGQVLETAEGIVASLSTIDPSALGAIKRRLYD